MEEILVTVVTVTFNAASSIEPTLESVVGQTFARFEWLVVDGKSADQTVAKIRAAEGRINRLNVVSEPDYGLYDAMNKALALASGKYVIFMNAGDVFADSEVLSDFATLMSGQRDDAAMVFGHTKVEFQRGASFLRSVKPLSYVWHGQPTIHQSVFFSRKIHLQFLYPYETYPISSDYAVMAGMQKNFPGKIITWNRIVSIFKNDSKSVSNSNVQRRIVDAWKVQRDIIKSPILLRITSAFRRFVVSFYFTYK